MYYLLMYTVTAKNIAVLFKNRVKIDTDSAYIEKTNSKQNF